MTLKQLEVFIAIAETHSFSKGADKTFITQSTASQHILTLEEELEIKLFDRGRSGALLTEAGKIFFVRARKILAECDESRSALRRFIGMEDVILRVGASNIPGTNIIPPLLTTFRRENPRVRLEVYQGDSKSVQEKLLEEDIEIGFVGGLADDARIQAELIGNDEIVCVVSPDFSNGENCLSQGELCKVPLVVREDGSGTQQAVYEALSGTWINKDSLAIIAVLGSSEAIKKAILCGVGYAFMSISSIREELASGLLTVVRIPGLSIARKLYAIHRKGRELSPAATAFLDLVVTTSTISR